MMDLDQKLSAHFTLREFVKSQTATRRGIDNTPPAQVVENLRALCGHVLEPVRVHFDRPVSISSGYRGPKLNKAIGGASSSQHCLGEAADFEIPGVANLEVARWMERNLNYDQLILEFYTPGQPNSGWVHVSWREHYRNQELTAVKRGGRTVYLAGLLA